MVSTITQPPDINPDLWRRYLRGSKAVDDLYSAGKRCPSNPLGARCQCLIPNAQYCKFFLAVVGIAEEIGGVISETVKKIN